MEKRRVGKITVALTLIALGMALLFRERVDFESVYRLYLPAVLIVLGVEIIVSKYYYHKKGYDTRVEPLVIPLIILMLVSFVFGLTLEALDKGFEVNIFNELRYRESTRVSGELLFDSEESIGLDFKYADVEVLESETSQIEVYLEVEYGYNDSSKENLEVARFLSESRSEGRVDLVYDKVSIEKQNDIGIHKAKYIVKVPKKASILYLDMMYSDVQVRDLEVDILTERLKYASIEITSLTGEIELKSAYTDVTAENLVGSLRLNSEYSNIDISEIAGNLEFDIRYSDILVENKSASVGNIMGSGSYSDIVIDTVDNQDAIYDLSVSFGDIEFDKSSLDLVENMTEERLKGTVGRGDRKISISSKYGDIEIR